MAARVTFDPAFEAALREKLAGNLTDAIMYLNEEIKDKISVQGPPRSTPGNPPRVDSGDLLESIRHEDADEINLTAISTSDMPYATQLEAIDRPYFTSAFLENADEIGRRVLKT